MNDQAVPHELLFIEAPNRALIEVSGQDAEDFLHRMATAAIKSLKSPAGMGSASEARPTLFLKGDGRLVASCWIARPAHDRFVISTETGSRDELLQHLDRFIIMEKVEVRDLTPAYHAFLYWSPMYRNAAPDSGLRQADYMELADGHTFNILGFPGTASRREFWSNSSDGATDLAEKAANSTVRMAKSATIETYDHIRIAAGEPAWGAELSSSTVPLEAGLKHAIDFTKGCFPGQEVVARIENLGHPANMLVRLRSDASLAAGSGLFSGSKQVGRVTSALGEANGSIALGYVKWDYRHPGTQLQVGEESGPLASIQE
jgi:folate-binding protein YgfZ